LSKAEAKKREKIAKQAEQEIDKLYRGEIAFLKEVKSESDRAERDLKKLQAQSVNEIIASRKKD